MGTTLQHWLKADHITFLLIGPCIVLSDLHHWFRWCGFVLWTFALTYDICEDEDGSENGDER